MTKSKKLTKRTNSFKTIWKDIKHYNNKLKNKKGGNMLKNAVTIAKNLAVPAGFIFLKKALKKTQKKNGKKSCNKCKKGGFIRDGSVQHFYSPCQTNKVLLDKNNNTFNQRMNDINNSRIGKQPNIYSVNGRDLNVAADTSRSRYH